jgi:hypothetical protein
MTPPLERYPGTLRRNAPLADADLAIALTVQREAPKVIAFGLKLS